MEWKVGVSREKLLYCCCLITKSCPTLCDHMDCGSLGSLSMRFPRQKYWSGLTLPSSGNLPGPGIKPTSPALAGRFFTTEPPGKPNYNITTLKKKKSAVQKLLGLIGPTCLFLFLFSLL